MQHYDVILFDVDGTLIDSAPGILNTLEEVFKAMGVDVARSDLNRYIRSEEHTSELQSRFDEGTAYPGAAEMLRLLKEAGFVLCTATSKPTVVVTPILEEQGLAPYFDFIGGASMDESRDTKTEVVRYVLTQPCVQGKRVLMVGDRNDDMRGAADCGLDAAGALYGYGSREELEPFGPVLLAESCEELTDKLLACRANG